MTKSQEARTETSLGSTAARIRMIGPYKIIGRLGQGGMADVLLAFQDDPTTGFKRLVVVKQLRADLDDTNTDHIPMFLDEARLAARMTHANVVQTYEVGQDGINPYLSMEFLDGQSLNVVQRRLTGLKRQMPLEVALRIFCDLLAGLQYAHELTDFDGRPLGVIHRDVTPSNIFVKYDGMTKVVDFGIAKSAMQAAKTRAGMMKGKLAYMSPEQLLETEVGPNADVWAVGISIWETLAGKRLFRHKNDVQTIQAVLNAPVGALSELRPDVPKSLDAVLFDAIERDPKKRIQTAEEMKSRLEEIAVEIGKPLRHSDVKRMMQDVFGEAAQHNKKIVKEFLDMAGGGTATSAGEYLRVRSDGALEVKGPAMGGDPADQEQQPEVTGTAPTVTLPSTPPSAPSPTSTATTPASTAEAEITVSEPGEVEGAAEEPEGRPVWHWILFAVAILGFAVTAWLGLKG